MKFALSALETRVVNAFKAVASSFVYERVPLIVLMLLL
ncbi:hypothetical protein V426_1769 [Acinetobacter baumannii UH9907]|nr:hypothetical protein V426_1769 [Acinetobacter baumannii UH9907]